MVRRVFPLVFICVFLAAFLVTPAKAKSYQAERFDVHLEIQPGGSLLVTETVTFHFEGGPFIYVFRDISRSHTDSIQVLDAGMDGVTFKPGKEPDQVEIIDGDPIKVTWHFNPQNNSTHQFILHYLVQGVIRKGENDTIIWAAIPEEHDYSIKDTSITLVYPSTARPVGLPSINHPAGISHLDNGVTLTSRNISENESVILTANFPSGSLTEVPPAWQAEAEAESVRALQVLPYGLAAFIIGILVGLLHVIWFTRRFRRENFFPPDLKRQVTILPSEIAPALAGRLAGSGMPYLGTLFDLARRGLLGFEEGKKQWGMRNFNVNRLGEEVVLAPHEQAFAETFFHKGDSVSLADIGKLAYNSKLNGALDKELTETGLRDAVRSALRKKMLLTYVVIFVLGIPLFIAGIILALVSSQTTQWITLFGAALAGIGLAALVMGLAGLFVAALLSTLSNEGEHQAAAWKGFSRYLHDVARGRVSGIQPELFDLYLPYAAVFGILSEWGKFFSKMEDVPMPAWLAGLGNSLEDGSFAAMMAVITAADSSASAAASGGAGGASGGGASGAG